MVHFKILNMGQMKRSTRGSGIFETFLANIRYNHALNIIKRKFNNIKIKRILDIGSGNYPLFLCKVNANQKYGVDKLECTEHIPSNISLSKLLLNEHVSFEFENDFFDVITILAVWEHLTRNSIIKVCNEAHRMLEQNGIFIITTPSPIGQNLLLPFSKLNLVSKEEIAEHISIMSLKEIKQILGNSGFSFLNIKTHYFTFGLNQLIVAIK